MIDGAWDAGFWIPDTGLGIDAARDAGYLD